MERRIFAIWLAAWSFLGTLAHAQELPDSLVPNGTSSQKEVGGSTQTTVNRIPLKNALLAAPQPVTMGFSDKSPEGTSPVLPGCSGDSCGQGCCNGVCGPPGRFWVGGEYLLWWTKGQSFPPLVTTSPQGTPLANSGILGLPTTSVLFGGDQGTDFRSGGRFTAGMWLNCEQTFGIQGRYYFLENIVNHYSFSSTGNPILAIPFQEPDGSQHAFITAYPGAAQGTTMIDTSSRFYGGDFSFLCNLCCGCNYRVDALAGWRGIHLDEDYHLQDLETLTTPAGVPVGSVLSQDSFRTRNHFDGADLGLTGEIRRGCWFINGTGRVALGCMRQTVDIGGSALVNNTTSYPAGLFALPSNTGHYSRSVFAVAPEVNFNVGCQVTNHLRLFLGYTFLYLNNVVRPGDQIDTTINPNQLPPPVPGGPARPAFHFNSSDFWAQGANIGVEVRW